MKKLITFFFICCFTAIYGQQTNTKQDRWETYTNPNTDSYYYHHFKKYINDELISVKLFPRETSKIILEFNLDSIYNAVNIRTNTTNKPFKDAILKAFKEIDFSNISIKSASAMHNYSLQIMAIENGKAILKCSSSVLHETLPILEGCEKNSNYKDYKKCFISNLEYYIETTIDSTIVENRTSEKDLKIYSKIDFNKTGKLDVISVKSIDTTLVEGIKKTLNNFNLKFRPATLNGITDDFEVDIIVNSGNLGIPAFTTFFDNASSENELAKHFKKELSAEIINLADFNLKKKNITLTFYINDKNEVENIHTNTNDEQLEEAIINAFKKFPAKNLNLPYKSPLNNYVIQVITSENNLNIIKCNEPLIFETLPIFNGCEKSKNILILKKCNQKTIQDHVKFNFDLKSATRNLNKTGIIRIYAIFKVSNLGEIANIRVKAPTKDLENETISVLKTIKIKNPGTQRGKSVNVSYSLPITFKIEDKPEIQNQNTNSKSRNY